ncbi:MAG: tryptophan synthase subunit alpha [Desulfobacterales bacterium]
MMLETYLRQQMKEKEILLMTHIVLGYPSFEDSFGIVEAMVQSGVDLIELQIPFSEPIADGPVILHANQKALARGTTVSQCLDFSRRVAGEFDIPFLFMSYYNILFRYGVDRFAQTIAGNGMQGAIVPDLPPEEGQDYLEAMGKESLSPIFIFSPTTSDERMRYLASFGKGFIYCVSRKGVTGAETEFSEHLDSYLQRCRDATDLPLALGFGVKDKADVDFLRGKADIAVVGSQMIRLIEAEGVDSVGPFIKSLR